LYFVDAESSSLRFYFEGFVKTLVGSGLFDFGFKDGDRKKAKLQHPLGIYADVTGIFVADSYNHSIRRYDAPKQSMETVVGDGKPGEGAAEVAELGPKTRLNEPSGIEKLAEGVFAISDTNNHRIVVWTQATGKVERMKVVGEKSVKKEVSGGAGEESAPDAAVAGVKRMSVRLPNTIGMPDAVVNRTSPEIQIVLPEGYHLNVEGPSFARLFEGEPPKEVFKREWKREDLVKSLTLKVTDLKAGVGSIFQGTFYFCTEAKNSVCEIASVSFPIRLDPSGAEKITVALSGQATKK
jgi:hypothetical protein